MKGLFSISIARKPVLAGLIVFIVAAVLTQYLAYQRYLINRETRQNEVLHEINTVKDRLKSSLSYSLSATKTLAFIVEEYGVPRDFNSVAKEILASNKNIDALELTRRGVVTHVYPFQENKSIIGYDVLADSTRNKEAYKAIEKKELFFAGPLELKQGGLAIVGRLPIFVDSTFWGFSVVLIKMSTLCKAAGIDSFENSNFSYQLSKINPVTLKEEMFIPGSIPSGNNQFASIEVPDGEWKLYAMLKGDKNFYLDVVAFSLLGLFLSVILAAFSWFLARQPDKLNRLVKEKTLQLASSEKYFRSLIEKSTDAIVLLDSTGKVLYQSPSTERISGYTMNEIQSFNGLELIHPDDREANRISFMKFVISHGATMNRNYRFKHKDGHYIWLEGTYTNLLNDENVKAIVYNYHDISQRVEAEEQFTAEKVFSESIINSLPGIFYLYNKDRKLIRWNKNLETVTGYSAEQIKSMQVLDFFHTEEKPMVDSVINTAFIEDFGDATAHLYTKNREKIPYDFKGRNVNFSGVDYRIGMGIDVTSRTKAEKELRERSIEIQELTAHLESIREEERTRIAREIHDELGQQLTGLKMDASWVAKRLAAEERAIHEKISGMLALIDETIKTVRRISSELRPGILDDLGLMAALEWQAQEFEKRTGINSKFHTDLIDINSARELSTNIFRVYQEALTNVARHSHATKVETSLEENNGYITLQIKDNGQGFDTKKIKNKNSWGLIGMKERALMFHGQLTIESEVQKGTVIVLSVPLLKTDNHQL